MAKDQQAAYSTLIFPTAGVYKRLGLQRQSPFTTPSANNVRPDDVLLGRERGGTRCGIEKAYSTQLGSGNPVNLISEVRYASGGSLVSLLVAASNGSLYPESGGTFGGSLGSGLGTGYQLSAVDMLSKLYIAGQATCKVYDPVGATYGNLGNGGGGTAPTNCRLVAKFQDRLVLAGDTGNPHIWYMSAGGDPTNWDYSVTDDYGAAVSADNSGQVHMPSPITALITHSNACLIFGCIDSISICRGNPRSGGAQMAILSHNVGILGPGAWCYTPDGFMFFMSSDGLYVMPDGCGSAPTRVSRERIPEDLLGISMSTHEVSMAYDIRFAGIHLMVSHRSSGSSTHYWIDTTTISGGSNGGSAVASFWPMTYPTTYRPMSLYARNTYVPSSINKSSVLMGGNDGYVRRQSADLTTDDGTAIESHLDFGPFPLGAAGYEGLLDKVDLTLALNSGSATLACRAGQTAEEAYNAATFDSQTVAAGLNSSFRPRMRGSSALLRLSSSSAIWAYEDCQFSRSEVGPRRIY
jgi:hypothetical protein